MDFKNEFSWSKSRDELFNECKKKYYFNHYGCWGGWEPAAPERVRELYILKNLSTRQIWIGNIVHIAIKDLLLQYRAGMETTLSQLIYRLKKRINEEFNDSLQRAYKNHPKYKMGLLEHEYGLQITQDKWDELFKVAEKSITNFFNSDIFKEIKRIDTSKWVIIESGLESNPRKPQSFDFEGVRIWLKIDFAIKEDNKIIIYDWKTGKERDVEMGTQLACYALYVLQKWNINPNNIIIKKYNVAIDKWDEFGLNEEIIEDIKEYMRGSIKIMKKLLIDQENNVAKEEDFKKTTDIKTCLRCNFKKVCDIV